VRSAEATATAAQHTSVTIDTRTIRDRRHAMHMYICSRATQDGLTPKSGQRSFSCLPERERAAWTSYNRPRATRREDRQGFPFRLV